jgi:hypothetical protein
MNLRRRDNGTRRKWKDVRLVKGCMIPLSTYNLMLGPCLAGSGRL